MICGLGGRHRFAAHAEHHARQIEAGLRRRQAHAHGGTHGGAEQAAAASQGGVVSPARDDVRAIQPDDLGRRHVDAGTGASRTSCSAVARAYLSQYRESRQPCGENQRSVVWPQYARSRIPRSAVPGRNERQQAMGAPSVSCACVRQQGVGGDGRQVIEVVVHERRRARGAPRLQREIAPRGRVVEVARRDGDA